VRVVVADDSVLVREGLARLLGDAGFEVVGTAEDAAGLLERVERRRPDVAIVDIKMPPTHTDEGLAAAQAIRRAFPAVGVLVLSQYLESRYAARLLEEAPERVGYLLKDRVSEVAEFLDGMRRVAAGATVLDPEVVGQLLVRRRRDDPLRSLTPREREVLGLMAEGRSNTAIARKLVVTDGAVEKHVKNIFTKLDLAPDDEQHRRVLAVLTFLQS
jgi:DNA-binding NarL/FixJ family response regulator